MVGIFNSNKDKFFPLCSSPTLPFHALLLRMFHLLQLSLTIYSLPGLTMAVLNLCSHNQAVLIAPQSKNTFESLMHWLHSFDITTYHMAWKMTCRGRWKSWNTVPAVTDCFLRQFFAHNTIWFYLPIFLSFTSCTPKSFWPFHQTQIDKTCLIIGKHLLEIYHI